MRFEGSDNYVDKLISNLAPKEIIYQRGYEDRFSAAFGSKHYTYRLDEWVFSEEVNREKLCKQFTTTSLKGFGVDHFTSGISAAGAILYYLEFTEHRDIAHIRSISRIDQDDYVWVDKFTIRNLELFSSNGGREKCSFADVIDRTLTPMGGRLLKRWIAMPVKDTVQINERLDVVGHFVEDADLADTVREQVALVGDMERIASRIAAARVTPRELVQLKNSLFAVELLKAALESTDDDRLHALAAQIDLMTDVRDRIAREIYPDPLNNQIQKGGVIADGVDPELDDLRRIALHGKDYLARIQQRESETTGIPSLKISYNNVFGYYIEVRNAHKDKVPQSWIRKQTLANAERYITEELKEYEEKILGAEEKMLVIEQRIYERQALLCRYRYLLARARELGVRKRHLSHEDGRQADRSLDAELVGDPGTPQVGVDQQHGVIELHRHADGQVDGAEALALPRQRARDHDQVGIVDRRGALALHVAQQRAFDDPELVADQRARSVGRHGADRMQAIEIDLDALGRVARAGCGGRRGRTRRDRSGRGGRFCHRFRGLRGEGRSLPNRRGRCVDRRSGLGRRLPHSLSKK